MCKQVLTRCSTCLLDHAICLVPWVCLSFMPSMSSLLTVTGQSLVLVSEELSPIPSTTTLVTSSTVRCSTDSHTSSRTWFALELSSLEWWSAYSSSRRPTRISKTEGTMVSTLVTGSWISSDPISSTRRLARPWLSSKTLLLVIRRANHLQL